VIRLRKSLEKPGKRPSVVKSAERTLRVLEFFDEIQHPTNVVAVARALQCPQSSAAALLRSLVSLGYLTYLAAPSPKKRRTYAPTERVALLGSWISPQLFGETKLRHIVRSLNQRLGLAVVLAARNGDSSQYIHVQAANTPTADHVRLGIRNPLNATSAGLVLLSGMSDHEVQRMYRRINAYAASGEEVVKVPRLLEELEQIRRSRYAYTFDKGPPSTGLLSIRLPAGCSLQPLVLGIGGPTETIIDRKHEILSVMQQEIQLCLGSSQRPAQATNPGQQYAIRPPVDATSGAFTQ
jgi:DNA-binding IclR family transcriptional regulator